jgi:hypothetical protein
MELDSELIRMALQASENEVPEVINLCRGKLDKDPNNISALYATHILSLRTGDKDAWVTSLRNVFLRIAFHPDLIIPFLGHLNDAKNILILAEAYIGKYPNETHGYMMQLVVYRDSNDMQSIRKVLKKLYRRSKTGIHFQPYTIASIFDAARGAPNLSMETPTLVQEFNKKFWASTYKQDNVSSPAANKLQDGTSPQKELDIVTSVGEPIGLNRAVLNGQIIGASIPTTYYFRYGSHPNEMAHKTICRQVPPGRFGRLKDTSSNIFRRLNAVSLTASFIKSDEDKFTDGVSMKIEGPFGKDRNHREGIGVIDLLLGWQSAVHLRGKVPSTFETPSFPKPIYPGEAIDLSDAKFTVTYRTEGLDAKDFFPIAWVHGASGEAFYPEISENYSAWANTGDLGSWQFNDDGKWNQASFSFECNSKAWSFCGSNVEEMGTSMERICYHPIGNVIRENRSGNICLCFVYGDEMKPPKGDIEIGALELSYRSYSLLAPDQGVTLIDYPTDSKCDASFLTGGWIGTFEHSWHSVKNPKERQEIVWRFREDASIRSVRLHQNPLWPAKEIKLSISDDGIEFEKVWRGSLDDVPKDLEDWPKTGETGIPFNFAKTIVFDDPIHGKYLRLSIKSGYRQVHWGLDAIEVFGDAPTFIPSPEPVTVSEEISDLETGPLFVQLVTENEKERTEGEIVELARPTSLRPTVSTPVVISRLKNSTRIRFRTNAMGFWGELSGEIINANTKIGSSATISIGKQEVSREAVLQFDGLSPSGAYEGTAIASNEHGKSELCKFIIAAEKV